MPCAFTTTTTQRRLRSGVTLVEVLVAIGIIGVLISLALPALSRVRSAARASICLANLQSIGRTFELYLQEHDGEYPFAEAGAPLPIEGGAVIFDSSHWSLAHHWPSLMHGTAPWPEHFQAWICPGSPRDPKTPWRYELGGGYAGPSYRYCYGFFARPQVWTPEASADVSLLKPIRRHEPAHPSRKVMLFDGEMAHLPHESTDSGEPRPMLFADSHASLRQMRDATEPIVNPFTEQAIPLHDTPDGVYGRDY